ncbi:cytochrome P450 [Lentinula edodes]|nr:cytochrome P450 [Lentinula edodes]
MTLSWHSPKRRPLGPRQIPIIGNLLSFPAMVDMVSQAQVWKKTYGNMVYMSAFRTKLLIVNNLEVAMDLLEHMGTILSDRPHLTMIGDLCGFDRLPAISSDGGSPRLRALRKALHSEIGSKNVLYYAAVIEESCKAYIERQLSSPDNFRANIQWFAVNTILKIAYGTTITSDQEEHMVLSERIMRRLSQDAKPGKWIVDIFPFLRFLPEWVPGMSFKVYAKTIRTELDDWVRRPYELVKEQNTASHSFCHKLISSSDRWTTDWEDIVIWSSASLYSAGTDTTASALSTFYLAMVCFPDSQRKAQQEIFHKFPQLPGDISHLTFENCKQLPYVHALLLEVLRWGAILPLGAPRHTKDTIVYNGNEIPRGCTVFVNIWGISHDPLLYPDPKKFSPERYLEEVPQLSPWNYVFGFGKRICPGRYLAEQTLLIAIANTLANFHIEAIDGAMPAVEYDDGFIRHPKPFHCSILPLSTSPS